MSNALALDMKQYQVPQFINVEDRIIGPFTLKQFLYLLGAAAIIVVGITLLNIIFFILFALPLAVFFISLAFVKVSSQPLPTIFGNAMSYYTRPRLYIWKSVEAQENIKAQLPTTPAATPLPSAEGILSENKLSDLAWSLDIKEHVERRYR